MKLPKTKLLVGLFLFMATAALSFVLPRHTLAANFIDGNGQPASINAHDNTRFTFIDPFTIQDNQAKDTNGKPILYTTATTACNGDNIYVCDSGDVFYDGSYWYWPNGQVAGSQNGQCVSAIVLHIRQNNGSGNVLPSSGTGLNASRLFVVNAHNGLQGSGCYVQDTSGSKISAQDITGWGAKAQEDIDFVNTHATGTVVNQSDVTELDAGNSSDRNMFLGLATEFQWISPNEIDSVMQQRKLNKVTDAPTVSKISTALARDDKSTKPYATGYDYYVNSQCINNQNQILALLAVKQGDPSEARIIHREGGNGSSGFRADSWQGDQQSCLYGENHWNSPNRLWIGGSRTDATIGMADVANYLNPGTFDTSGGSGGNGSGSGSNTDPGLQCGMSNSTLNWIVCPVINIASDAAQGLDNWISSLLNADINQTFGSSYKAAWSTFRILATAILLIAGLIMVVSQAMGFEALDAYTVRKVLPRLLVAVIGVSLSWPLMKFVVEFFNVFGHDVYGLITGPFNTIGATVNPITGGLTSFLLVPIAGAVALFVFGPAALLMILSGLLGLFMAFGILVIRQIAITVMVIAAPIAIVCYILPNTQKVWNVWRENFLGLMMMYPIVMAFIAAGHAFAMVSLNHGGGISTIIGIIAYFIPYFLLPMAFRMATGAIGTIAGMVNDRSKGVFDRLKNVRTNAAKRNWQKTKEGERFEWMNGNSKGRAFNAGLQRLTRPDAVLPGRLGVRGRSALSTNMSGAVNEAAKTLQAQGLLDDAAGNEFIQHGHSLGQLQKRVAELRADGKSGLADQLSAYAQHAGNRSMMLGAMKLNASFGKLSDDSLKQLDTLYGGDSVQERAAKQAAFGDLIFTSKGAGNYATYAARIEGNKVHTMSDRDYHEQAMSNMAKALLDAGPNELSRIKPYENKDKDGNVTYDTRQATAEAVARGVEIAGSPAEKQRALEQLAMQRVSGAYNTPKMKAAFDDAVRRLDDSNRELYANIEAKVRRTGADEEALRRSGDVGPQGGPTPLAPGS